MTVTVWRTHRGSGVGALKGTDTGLLRHDLFQHRNYGTTMLATFTSGMLFFGGQAYLPQEVLYLFTADPIMTSIWTYPYNVAAIVGAATSGIFMAYTKEAKGLMIWSFAGLTLGSGLTAIMHPGINFSGWFFPTAILGFSVGIQVATSIVAVGLCTPDRFIGQAVSLVGAVRRLGGSIGITIFGLIFSSKVTTFLPRNISNLIVSAGISETAIPEIMAAIASGSTEALKNIPGMTPDILGQIDNTVTRSYADTYRFVWYSLIPFSAVSLLISLFLKTTKDQMTGVVAAGVQRRHAH